MKEWPFTLNCPEHNQFWNYLQSEWLSCQEMWCRSKIPVFLNNWNVRTNNHIESFHRVLKYTKIDKRKLRIDELITLLKDSLTTHYTQLIRVPNLKRLRVVQQNKILRAADLYVNAKRVHPVDPDNGIYQVDSISSPGSRREVNLLTKDGPTCSCPSLSTLQCVHILACSLLFAHCNENGFTPLIPRAPATMKVNAVQNESDVEDTEKEEKNERNIASIDS
jgi:hypothetical protein